MDKDKGLEYLDDTPVAVPLKFKAGAGEVQRLKMMMREVFHDLRNSGVETFEESLDFNIDEEDDDPLSHSEMRYMKEERLLTEAEEAARVVADRHEMVKYKEKYHGKGDPSSGRERIRNGDARSDNVGDKRGKERGEEGRPGEAAQRGAGASKGSGDA